MKPNELLENAIGKIDDDLLFDAEQARNQKPRRRFAFFAAAACLTVMLLAIPLGILIANQTDTPEVPVVDTTTSSLVTTQAPIITQAPATTEKPKASVLDIPGAVLYNENDHNLNYTANKYFGGRSSLSDEEFLAWANNVKKENKVVVGTIQNATSVIVDQGDDLYRITYMDCTVLDDVSMLRQKTIRVAYACRYTPSGNAYKPVTPYFVNYGTEENKKTRTIVNDMAYIAEYSMKDSMFGASLFLLKDAKDQTLSLISGSINFSDYADYVLDASFAYSLGSDTTVSWSLSTSSKLRFRLSILRSVIHNSLTLTQKQAGVFFSLENSFETFGNNPALSVTVDNECLFYDDIFIVTNTRPKLDQTYKWVVNIEGNRFAIDRVWHYKFDSGTTFYTPPSVTLYFDLGANFPWEAFACNENREYTFRDVSLELYDKDNNPICTTNLIDLWKCDGYTHTLPSSAETPSETIDRFSKGIDILLGKKSYSNETNPNLVLIKPMNNTYFRLENAYDDFQQNPALVLSVNKDSNSVFIDLFLDEENPQVNTDFVWNVIIEGITYEVEQIAFESTDTEFFVYLDLGQNFRFSGYRFNENNQYTFQDVTLGIYFSHNSQIDYDYFANLGSYTHTKPE